MGVEPSSGHMRKQPETASLKKINSSSYQPPIATQLDVQLCDPTSPPMLEFCLACSCVGLVYALKTTVDSCVQWSCIVQKTFHSCSPLFLAFTDFLLHLLCWSLRLRKRRYDTDDPCRCSFLFSSR